MKIQSRPKTEAGVITVPRIRAIIELSVAHMHLMNKFTAIEACMDTMRLLDKISAFSVEDRGMYALIWVIRADNLPIDTLEIRY